MRALTKALAFPTCLAPPAQVAPYSYSTSVARAMASYPEPLVVPAAGKHTATVFFLHGLGDTGAGWVDAAKNWRRRGRFDHVKFVFPTASKIPITINFGMSMPGWYDILGLDDFQERNEDEAGVLRSREYLESLMKAEISAGIPSSRLFLAGFSQGGAMSIFTGCTSSHKIAGIAALSGYMVLHKSFKSFIPADAPNQSTPIFMGHGDADPVVKYVWGQKTQQLLQEWGWKVDFHTYHDLVHSVDMDEFDDLENFIVKCLPEEAA